MLSTSLLADEIETGARRAAEPSTPTLDGLTRDEAARLLVQHGPNRFVERGRWSRIAELSRMLADPMALMLAAGALIYWWLGDTRDAVVLAVAIVPVLGIDVLLEERSRKTLARLAAAVAPRARVVRDGAEREIDTESIVPRDLLVLREGCAIHADGVVVQSANLAVDEAHLTGESEPQHKEPNAGDASRFYAGSMVLAGRGLGLVTATGPRTRFGEIGRLVAETAAESTPLQRSIARFIRRFIAFAAAVVVLVVVLELARGGSWSTALISAVSLAMSAAPEEFPLVFTLFLALGAWRLARRGVLVRRLASVETLGSTDVICVDKTGTLTHGRFALAEHRPLGAQRRSDEKLLEAAALACEPQPFDPLERAILAHCAEHGIDVAALHRRWSLVHDYDFDPRGKHMSHVWRAANGDEVIAAKGALEGILEHCRASPDVRAEADAALRELASQGVRVLAVAVREVARDPSSAENAASFTGDRAADERDLELVGLLGFRDPLRGEVPGAIAECRRAGIDIKLITGDHPLTAFAIASAAGITQQGANGIVLGSDIDELEPRELAQRVLSDRVFARVRPAQKLAVVEALQSAGKCVAMTGDGINDAPALRRADIGVSMGPGATEAARGAADLVLLENDFGALVDTVREGRTIFLNIRRAFLYLIAFHVPVVLLALVPPLLDWPLLMLPLHVVWLQLIVHPVSAFLFEDAPPPSDVMRAPPRRSHTRLWPRGPLVRSAASGLLLTLAALAIYGVRFGSDVCAARAMALVVVIAGNLLLVFAERAMDRPWWEIEFPRRARFWIVWLGVAASLIACLRVPALSRLLELAPLSSSDLAIAIGLAIASVAWRFFGFARARRAITTDRSIPR